MADRTLDDVIKSLTDHKQAALEQAPPGSRPKPPKPIVEPPRTISVDSVVVDGVKASPVLGDLRAQEKALATEVLAMEKLGDKYRMWDLKTKLAMVRAELIRSGG